MRFLECGSEGNESQEDILGRRESEGKTGLDLVATALNPEQEQHLWIFLYRRLRKGAMYVSTGNFSGMDFSLVESPSSPAICYYILLPCQYSKQESDDVESNSRLVICLLASCEATLEVFRSELAQFCESVSHELGQQNVVCSPEVTQMLENWYYTCIQHVSRVVHLLGANVAYVLQLAQQNRPLQMGPGVESNLADDITRFVRACSLSEFLKTDSQLAGVAAVVNVKNGDLEFENVQCNSYCMEWTKLLIGQENNTSSKMKRILDAFKLKTIKDMNILKRLLKQAETDHYALYRAYSFLKQSGNSDILLQHAKLEGDSSADVLQVLEEYLQGLDKVAVLLGKGL